MKTIFSIQFLFVSFMLYCQTKPYTSNSVFEYDNNNNLIQEKRNGGYLTTYKYNSNNQLIEAAYGSGINDYFEYSDQKLSKIYNDYRAIQYHYRNDKIVMEIKTLGSRNFKTLYEYNEKGDTISVKSFEDSLKMNPTRIKKFIYDNLTPKYKTMETYFNDWGNYTLVEYFNKHRQIVKRTELKDKKEILQRKYLYDKRHRLIEEQEVLRNIKWTYAWDGENVIEKSKYSTKRNKLLESEKFDYNDKNLLSSKKLYEYNREQVIEVD